MRDTRRKNQKKNIGFWKKEEKKNYCHRLDFIGCVCLCVRAYYVLHPGRHDVFIVFSEIWMHVCHALNAQAHRERTEAEDEDDGKTRRQNTFGSHYVTLRCIISCVARGRDNILFFFSLLFICLIGIFRFLPRTRFGGAGVCNTHLLPVVASILLCALHFLYASACVCRCRFA